MKSTLSAGFCLLLILSTAFAALSSSSFAPTDRDLDGLIGAVERVEEEEAEMKLSGGALVEGPRRRSLIMEFDRQGRKTRQWTSIADLDPNDRFFTYEEQPDQRLRYDSDKPVHEKNTTSNQYSNVSVFRFDAGENAVYRDAYSSARPSLKTLTQKWKYQFDLSGRIIEESVSSPQGKIGIRNIQIYGPERHPIERHLYLTGKAMPQIIKYTYTLDAKGNWIKRVAQNTLSDQDRTQLFEVTYRKISYY